MTAEKFKKVIEECLFTGSLWIEQEEFLEFLPTNEQQISLAQERILTTISSEFQNVRFQFIPEEVEE
jgi:hypothetical protein